MGDRNRLPRRRNTRLLEELERQGRSIAWFCRQMGVSRFAVWRIEGGRAGGPLDWYERAARVLDVTASRIAPRENVEEAA